MKQLLLAVAAMSLIGFAEPAKADQQNHRETFAAANQHYASGEYDMALRLYERLADTNQVHNAILYLNLGNAYYRTGSMGRAIHAYRRGTMSGTQDARVLESLEQNIEVARAQLSDRYRSGSENRQFIFENATGMLHTITHLIERGLLTTLFLVFWCMLCGTLVLRRLRPNLKGTGVSAITVGIPSLLFGLMLMGQIMSSEQSTLGIIVEPEISLQEAPHQEANGHDIPEGMEVKVLEQRDEWTHVELANGREGFVPTQAIATL